MISHLFAGLALGLFFYGGLWFTVRSLATVRHPGLWTVGSFWLRTAVVIAAFVLIARSRWDFALIAILGFSLARLVVTQLLRGPKCT
jgi:F1F0 ATPase subunit 2